MTNRFQNKVAVVTGAASGIGLAAAKAFAQGGASAFVTGRSQDLPDAAVAVIGGKVTACAATWELRRRRSPLRCGHQPRSPLTSLPHPAARSSHKLRPWL